LTIVWNVLGLLWLLLVAACGGGGGGPSCTEGQSCTAPTACRAGVTSCTGGVAVCVDAAVLFDGTSCTSGGSCQAGICRRTVSGTFRTTFWTDDGAKTTVNRLPRTVLDGSAGTPSALLVADSTPNGYSRFPITVDANQGFSVPGVPAGPYFLELDRTELFAASCGAGFQTVEVTVPQLFQQSTSAPDLDTVTAARPDLVEQAGSLPQLKLDITGMDPWGSSDQIRIASSQALGNQIAFFSPAPIAGATTFSGTTQWIGFGLPDASKHDVVFMYQRATTSVTVGGNAATIRRATKFKRLVDLTVPDGTTTTAAVPLESAPQTGSVRANLASAQFAALAADVNPQAVLVGFGLGILTVPHSATYPDMPLNELVGGAFSLGPSSPVDADYGTFAYPQFLDPFWKEFVSVGYTFEVSSVQANPLLFSDIPLSALPAGPMSPVLGPPKAPQVNGSDAFVPRSGVGVQPTISWAPPTIGNPTSYIVEIKAIALPCASGQVAGVTAVIHSGLSFKVPPGILIPGVGYRATITARQAPWDTPDTGPFRTGVPLHSAQCVTAQFVR